MRSRGIDLHLRGVRNVRPTDRDRLWEWAKAFMGTAIARSSVCCGHSPPFEWFADVLLNRPPLVLVLGPRGGGKSFLSAISTHMDSRHRPRHGTRILGGSRAQASQIFDGIEKAISNPAPGLSDASVLDKLMKESARYRNGSRVEVLAASSKSVRGPHVPSLKLDEVDEIDPDIRESAMGMNMAQHGVKASAVMTSTWHRVNGPMAALMERGRSGDFPVHEFCTFEVLERCPESRSGKPVGGHDLYENCPACPLVKWCHAERDRNGNQALAKLADGHYAIDSLAQKVASVSLRVFEADYLCKGPKADGLWFKGFDPARHVGEHADYDPHLPVHLAVDSGVFTGAVAFQVRPGWPPKINVFMDFLAEGVSAEPVARAIVAQLNGRDGTGRKSWTDPAGNARNPVGATVISLYRQHGLADVSPWPGGSVSDGLALIDNLLCPADGAANLTIHPRCKALVAAFANYRRAKRGGQWQDHPEDPQHPHEDVMDALRGGLRAVFPGGLQPPKVVGLPAHPHRLMF